MNSQNRGARGPGLPAVLRRALGGLPSPGEAVELPLDLAVLGGAAAPETARLFNESGARVWDSARVALTLDFPAPGVEVRVPRSRAVCREFAAGQGLRNVYDLNLGIGVHVILEMGVVTPGDVVTGCGRCLHQIGAVGALALNAEPGALAEALKSGRLVWRMPQLVQLVIEGTPRAGFGAYDMALLAAEALESCSADTIVEFSGRAVEALPMDGRFCLIDVGAEAFRSGLIAADGVTQAFYKERREGGIVLPPPGAAGAGDVEVRTLNLDGKGPLVQGPGPGGPLRPLSELAGKKIHSAFIGSCAAGRASDLMEAAGIIKRARRIHPDVRLTIAPATLEVARGALGAGFYEIFLDAGAMLDVAGSSPGMAGGAVFGEGEIILSTAPYNSPVTDAGRGPDVYRASPAAVATAAIAGEIRDPAEM